MNSTHLILAVLLVATLPVAHAQYPGSKPVPAPLAEGFADIDEQSCRTWLTYLASDELAGRKTGTEGHRKAAAYIAARFKEFGLKPIGDDGTYFQEVTLYRLRRSGQKAAVTVGKKDWTHKKGLRTHLSMGSAKCKAVYVASASKKKGLKDPSILRDRILILNATPNARLSPLYRQVRENHPRGIILCGSTPSPLSGGRPGSLLQKWQAAIPQVSADEATFAAILKALKLKGSAAKPQKNSYKMLKTEREVAIDAEIDHEVIKAPNVIGMLEGSSESLKHEAVICGSHLDHIGTNRDGSINNGADDDGSGSTSLLAVARAFSRSQIKPKRSLVFIAVCGEEDGLLGSEYYVENPIIPIKDTVCELQMDMVGRNEEKSGRETAQENIQTTHLVGSKKLSMDLHKLIIKMNKHVGFKFEYDEESVYYRSDHYNFAKKGIPIAFFFSGFHPDYHKPTDTIEKINFTKLANTAKLVFLTAWSAADRTKRIVVDKKKKK